MDRRPFHSSPGLAMVVLLAAFFFCECSPPAEKVSPYHIDVKSAGESSVSNFPRPRVALPDDRAKVIGSARYLSEVFPVERAVRLEMTEESVLTEISDLIYLDGSWIVVDTAQDRVLQFDEDGNFLRMIGRRGEGPGEYLGPKSVKRCYGGNLAIYDGDTGRILVYDRDGIFILSTPAPKGPEAFLPRRVFVWQRPDRLYLGDFPTLGDGDDVPAHVILEPEAEGYRVVAGFGTRFPWRGWVWKPAFMGFEKIGDFLWVGSPYLSHLEIYDEGGGFVTLLNEARRGGANIHHYENTDLSDEEEKRELRKLPRTGKILQVGPLVVVRVGIEYDIYDRNGNVLNTHVQIDKTHFFLDGHGERLICALPQFDRKDYYNAYDLKALRRVGWREDRHLEENPYLRVGRLRY